MGGAFDQRYLLARYPTGGVVVDLDSGNYYRVNGSAALICESMRSGGDVDGRIAAELRISREEAMQLVSDMAADLAVAAIHDIPQGPYHFYPSDRGYSLVHDGRTVLEVTGPMLDIRLSIENPAPPKQQVELYVRALAPKLLFQGGFVVLHASACRIAGHLVAFAGLSGAGKTTTARAFASAGAELVSEDLVVLRPDARAEVFVAAEFAIHAWAREVTHQLSSSPGEAVRPTSLARFADGPTMQLDQILILDRSQRSGRDFATAHLTEQDALISLMPHDFLGAIEPIAWRQFFSHAIDLVASVDLRKTSAPEGVDLLVAAASRYILRTAS